MDSSFSSLELLYGNGLLAFLRDALLPLSISGGHINFLLDYNIACQKCLQNNIYGAPSGMCCYQPHNHAVQTDAPMAYYALVHHSA